MWGKIKGILVEKAGQGVDVWVLFDDLGCILKLPTVFSKQLECLGVKYRAFHKTRHFFNTNFNHHDQRKICIIDGNVGFNGGINLADEYINSVEVIGKTRKLC